MIPKKQPGMPALTDAKHGSWVQTERSAHDAWGNLVARKPAAATLLHKLVAHMDRSGAVVVSHGTLAALCGYSTATVKRAIADLKSERWIEVLYVGGKGATCAYIVNNRVAWADKRENLHLAMFSARVITSLEEQHEEMAQNPLRRIPTLMHPDELQLPVGKPADPPVQPSLEGLGADMPALVDEPETLTLNEKIRNARG